MWPCWCSLATQTMAMSSPGRNLPRGTMATPKQGTAPPSTTTTPWPRRWWWCPGPGRGGTAGPVSRRVGLTPGTQLYRKAWRERGAGAQAGRGRGTNWREHPLLSTQVSPQGLSSRFIVILATMETDLNFNWSFSWVETLSIWQEAELNREPTFVPIIGNILLWRKWTCKQTIDICTYLQFTEFTWDFFQKFP